MNSDEFYSKLKNELEKTTRFPTNYLFKFIVPNKDNNVQKIDKLFDLQGAVMETKPSKNGNYVGVSIWVDMNTADEIIEKYKQASTIKGIVSL